MKKRTVLVSGFAGIGGFDLAAKWMGWESAVLCEIDHECQVVLRHHFPSAYIHGDIRTLTGKIIDEEIKRRFGDEPVRVVWCSGFPCQPFSAAGKREGVDDNRYLWPEVARIIGEYRFDAIVLENVFGLTSILEPAVYAEMEREAVLSIRSCKVGLFDEPAKREKVEIAFEVVQQRVMGQILEDIEKVGYECPRAKDGSPVVLCVPACAVGAPHRRDRVWFVANSRRPRTRNNCGPVGDEGRGAGENRGKKLRQTHGKAGTGWNNTASPDGPFTHPGHEQPQGRQSALSRLQPHGRGKARGITSPLGGIRVAAHPTVSGHEEREQAAGFQNPAEEGAGVELEPERLGGWRDASNTQGTEYEWGRDPRGGRDGLADHDSLEDEGTGIPPVPFASDPEGCGSKGDWTEGEQVQRPPAGEGLPGCDDNGGVRGFWANFPTEWPLRIGDDGISARLGGVCVPGTGKKVTASSLNKFTLKAGGNAIVPQVAVSIFRALEATWENY